MLNNQKLKWLMMFLIVAYMILVALGFGNNLRVLKPQSLWLHLYIGYFVVGMLLSKINVDNLNCNIWVVILTSFILFASMSVVYMYNVNDNGGFPHEHYGKWYYILWLISIFIFTINIAKVKICTIIGNIIKVCADDTFVVYLGHLPILQYFTLSRPLQSLSEAVVCIPVYFVVCVVLAEIFRRLPLLRKIV